MSLPPDLRQRILRCVRAELDHGMLSDAVPVGTSDYDLNPGERPSSEPSHLRAAAVLVPIVEREAEPTILLTRRNAHLQHHAGQISFPGGRAEPDDQTPVETALREAEEEVGLDRSYVEVAGYLDAHETVTGFHITPVVGFVRPGFTLKLDPTEVDEAFEVPVSFLFDPANHQEHSRIFKGATRRYYAMPYRDYYIWGATARILVNLYRRAHGLQ